MSYYNKETALKQLLDEVQNRRNSYARALRTRKYLLDFIATIPDALFDKLDCFSTNVYSYSDNCSINFYYPWDTKLIKQFREFLQYHGSRILEDDSDDKSRTLINMIKQLPNGFQMNITASFSVSTKGSTCILVPLKTREETRTVVEVYDRICPDGHPELFKKNEDGQLIYIGDSFAPAE